MLDVYAPTPKNAAWPNEKRYACPPRMSQARLSVAYIKVMIMMC
jgi:hypothetical protein